MHTRDFDEKRISIHYNGDYSGDVIISQRIHPGLITEEIWEMSVPFSVLAEFIAGAVRDKRMERLENLEWFYLLGFDNEAP
jgi:hypothetical protein